MEAAAGLYSRVIFPGAFSKADPHMSALQKAMLDATPDCIKVVSVDGRLLTMNMAGCVALNVPQNSEFGMPWLPLLPEDVHELGQEALREAAEGRNARFPGKSLSPDGIRYWDNLLTPLIDASGSVVSILCVSRDVTAKTQLERELEDAISREKLLSREMQHRIKNVFSVVTALIFIAEKEAAKGDAPGTATKILSEKLGALSRASDAVFAENDVKDEGANEIDLEAIVSSVLRPYGDRCRIAGRQLLICRKTMTNIALLIHELATNSIKYGALGTDNGSVTIQWMADDEALDLTWIEIGGPHVSASPARVGFGSEMVDRIVRSDGGTINRTWRPEGLTVDLHLPNSFRY